MIALAVPDEHTLRELAEALGRQSLTYKLVIENDGPFASQAMAIGVAPVTDRSKIRRVSSHLPLVGKEPKTSTSS